MRVFAPGKLVLTGAYAVLAGAPAVVAATSRGAFADAARVATTTTPEVLAALGETSAPHVDASSLFLGGRKLGLGASAAILVASIAAHDGHSAERLADPQVRRALFERARVAHAASQSGGSGVDVAASVHGGVLEYVPGRATPRRMPSGLVLAVFACGTSARTSELRAFVDRLAVTDPQVHASCLGQLSSIAHVAAQAVQHDDRAGFIDAVRHAARGLARLGEASGAPIVPGGFDDLEEIAKDAKAAFCVSGAGGGDVACYFGSAAPPAAFVERARALGLFAIDVSVDEKGVRVVSQAAVVDASSRDGATGEHASTS